MADAPRVLGLPTAPVADLRQGVQCLGELLRHGRVERSDQSGHGVIGRQAGQRPGEHVADEEVRFDRASAHEGVEIAAIGSDSDVQASLEALLRVGRRERGDESLLWFGHVLHLLSPQ